MRHSWLLSEGFGAKPFPFKFKHKNFKWNIHIR